MGSFYEKQLDIDPVALEELVAASINKHGQRFLEAVGVETDRMIISAGSGIASDTQRVLRTGLRAAKMGTTARTRNVLTFLAHHRAQTLARFRMEQAKLRQIAERRGCFPENSEPMESPAEHVTNICTKLDREAREAHNVR